MHMQYIYFIKLRSKKLIKYFYYQSKSLKVTFVFPPPNIMTYCLWEQSLYTQYLDLQDAKKLGVILYFGNQNIHHSLFCSKKLVPTPIV